MLDFEHNSTFIRREILGQNYILHGYVYAQNNSTQLANSSTFFLPFVCMVKFLLIAMGLGLHYLLMRSLDPFITFSIPQRPAHRASDHSFLLAGVLNVKIWSRIEKVGGDPVNAE